ncbi:MAG: MBL fold metallo-hydrolase [Clostridia bacterium]|nr:MBL fold metallo-hydrolase [Clostridia bacterium]
MSEATFTRLFDNVWQVHEESKAAIVDAYLIVGEERCALVDCLQSVTGLYEDIRRITDKPIDVLITHGHLDHLGTDAKNLKENGARIMMDKRDWIVPKAMHGFEFPDDFFTEINDGNIIDLGGTKLEVMEIPGHTPGSVIFVDRENQRAYTGDGIGSGEIWLQIPFTSTLEDYRVNLAKLLTKLEELPNLMIFPGHRYQSPVQLGLEYVKDLLTITDKVIAGEIVGEPEHLKLGELEMDYKIAKYGLMRGYSYNPDRIHNT